MGQTEVKKRNFFQAKGPSPCGSTYCPFQARYQEAGSEMEGLGFEPALLEGTLKWLPSRLTCCTTMPTLILWFISVRPSWLRETSINRGSDELEREKGTEKRKSRFCGCRTDGVGLPLRLNATQRQEVSIHKS